MFVLLTSEGLYKDSFSSSSPFDCSLGVVLFWSWWTCQTFPSLFLQQMTSMTPASAPATWTFLMTSMPGWCMSAFWSQRTFFITTSPSQKRRTSTWGPPEASTQPVTVCCGPAKHARGRQPMQTGGKRRPCVRGDGSVKSMMHLRHWNAARLPIQTRDCPKWRSSAMQSATLSHCRRCSGTARTTASTRSSNATAGTRAPPAPTPTAPMARWVQKQLTSLCSASMKHKASARDIYS